MAPSPARDSRRSGRGRLDLQASGTQHVDCLAGPRPRRDQDDVIDAECGEPCAAGRELLGTLARLESRAEGLLDAVVIPAEILALLGQGGELRRMVAPSSGMSKRLQASAYWATRRSVLRSPMPPIRIGGRGPCERLGRADGVLELVLPAVERRCVARPHLRREAERFLQTLVAFRQSRQRQTHRAAASCA